MNVETLHVTSLQGFQARKLLHLIYIPRQLTIDPLCCKSIEGRTLDAVDTKTISIITYVTQLINRKQFWVSRLYVSYCLKYLNVST
jgi:hypothetical protein